MPRIIAFLSFAFLLSSGKAYRIFENGAVLTDVLNPDSESGSKVDPLAFQETDILQPPKRYRNAIHDRSFLWPNGVVPFVISSELENNARGMIERAFADFHQFTCIRFVPHTNELNWLVFIKGVGCYSYIGKQRSGAQQLSVGENCDHKGTILHEMLHTVGIFHEHNRVDRDSFVSVMWNNIIAGKESNFQKNDGLEYVLGDTLDLPYDYGSIMHYGDKYFSIDYNSPTIVPKITGITLGQRLGFSQLDVAKVRKLYGCSTVEPIVASTTLTTTTTTTSSTTTTTTTVKPTTIAQQPTTSQLKSSSNAEQTSIKATTPTSTTTKSLVTEAKKLCEDADSRCWWLSKGGGCIVYPGLCLFKCRLSCSNCEDSKCYDTEDSRYSPLCATITEPGDLRCLTESYKILCPKTCAYCVNKS